MSNKKTKVSEGVFENFPIWQPQLCRKKFHLTMTVLLSSPCPYYSCAGLSTLVCKTSVHCKLDWRSGDWLSDCFDVLRLHAATHCKYDISVNKFEKRTFAGVTSWPFEAALIRRV